MTRVDLTKTQRHQTRTWTKENKPTRYWQSCHTFIRSGLCFQENRWVIAMDSQTDCGNWWGFSQSTWWWQSEEYPVQSVVGRIWQERWHCKRSWETGCWPSVWGRNQINGRSHQHSETYWKVLPHHCGRTCHPISEHVESGTALYQRRRRSLYQRRRRSRILLSLLVWKFVRERSFQPDVPLVGFVSKRFVNKTIKWIDYQSNI